MAVRCGTCGIGVAGGNGPGFDVHPGWGVRGCGKVVGGAGGLGVCGPVGGTLVGTGVPHVNTVQQPRHSAGSLHGVGLQPPREGPWVHTYGFLSGHGGCAQSVALHVAHCAGAQLTMVQQAVQTVGLMSHGLASQPPLAGPAVHRYGTLRLQLFSTHSEGGHAVQPPDGGEGPCVCGAGVTGEGPCVCGAGVTGEGPCVCGAGVTGGASVGDGGDPLLELPPLQVDALQHASQPDTTDQ